jgi:hypothetical protein
MEATDEQSALFRYRADERAGLTQLKNVLGEMEGVSMVNIDLGRNSVEVGFKDPADEYQIMQGIEHVGCRIEG